MVCREVSANDVPIDAGHADCEVLKARTGASQPVKNARRAFARA
jgi:hypothetical protein